METWHFFLKKELHRLLEAGNKDMEEGVCEAQPGF